MATLNATRTIKNGQELSSETEAKAYIYSLACSTGIDISRWKLKKSFGDGAQIFRNKRELNKLFSEKLIKEKQKQKEKRLLDAHNLNNLDRLNEPLQKLVQKKLNKAIASSEKAIERKVGSVETLYKKIENKQKEAVELALKIEKMKSGKGAAALLKERIAIVVEQGMWVNPILDDKTLYFNTQHEIKVKYNGEEINFGKFAVAINMHNLSITVLPYKNNLFCYNSYIHPHIFYEGKVCWGNASARMVKWTASFEIDKVLTILYHLLSNYNNRSPTCNWSTFKRSGVRIANGTYPKPTSSHSYDLETWEAKKHKAHPDTRKYYK